MPLRVYEALVTNSAPSGAQPGAIRVEIPEIADGELPVDVLPLFPGWNSGGWHTVPGEKSADETGVRVTVIAVDEYSYRWIGTSQGWSTITDSPGMAGARSADGAFQILLSNDDIILEEVEGHRVEITKTGVYLKASASDTTERMMLAETVLTDLAAALVQLSVAPTALGFPTTDVAAFIANVTTSLAGGAPYLSQEAFNG